VHETELIEAEANEVGRRVREELARRRISRQALADMARISLSTLEKALAGTRPFTLASTIRLEEALETRLRPASADAGPAAPPAFAPETLGAYSRAAVRWIEGQYVTLRPSFAAPGDIFAYLTTIRWVDTAGHLGFAESQRLDAQFEQAGQVSMPSLSGHIYLVTNESGQYRLIVLGRPRIDGTLLGVLTTLQVGAGSQLVPVACPVALTRSERIDDFAIGKIASDHPHHERYRTILADATGKDFARFHL
jgi:hypothetical protein